MYKFPQVLWIQFHPHFLYPSLVITASVSIHLAKQKPPEGPLTGEGFATGNYRLIQLWEGLWEQRLGRPLLIFRKS